MHLFADAGAGRGIFQPLDEFRVAAIVRPGRNKGREAVEPGGICVRIGGDFDARPARLIDVRHNLRHAPPILTARRFQVPDFDRNVRFTADADSFVDGGYHCIALAAHVRGVDAAQFGALGREGDQFFRCGIGRRSVLQSRRYTHRSVEHGIAHQRLHFVQLRRSGSAIAIADHGPAHLRSAHIARHVDAHALLFQAREKLAESVPGRIDFVVLVIGVIGRADGVREGRRRSAFAGNLGGDALIDF